MSGSSNCNSKKRLWWQPFSFLLATHGFTHIFLRGRISIILILLNYKSQKYTYLCTKQQLRKDIERRWMSIAAAIVNHNCDWNKVIRNRSRNREIAYIIVHIYLYRPRVSVRPRERVVICIVRIHLSVRASI